ncbi:nuclear transport factor 2 family protein [Streptomyces tendae]
MTALPHDDTKRIALEFLSQVYVTRDADACAALVAPDFVQHIKGQPADAKEWAEFAGTQHPAAAADEPSGSSGLNPELVIAEDDRVTVGFYQPLPEADGSGEYDYFRFDTFRIRDGLIAEHWSSFNHAAPISLVLPAERTSKPTEPAPDRGAQGLAADKRVAVDLYRCVFDAMNPDAIVEIVAGDYVQHCRWRAEPGREGLETFVRSIFPPGVPRPPLRPVVANPPTVLMAEGGLVVYAQPRPQPDPADSSRTYTYLVYDVFKVRDGLLAEHWSGLDKNNPPKRPGGPPPGGPAPSGH